MKYLQHSNIHATAYSGGGGIFTLPFFIALYVYKLFILVFFKFLSTPLYPCILFIQITSEF